MVQRACGIYRWKRILAISYLTPGGGEMIKDVSLEWKLLMLDCPHKGNAECCWWNRFRNCRRLYERWLWKHSKQRTELLDYGTKRLLKLKVWEYLVQQKRKPLWFHFNIEGIHPHNNWQIRIVVRTGHHCANRLWLFDIPGTIRASFLLQYQRRNRRYGWSGEKSSTMFLTI
jgi:selenocysteine lyase/cysteine desulfurase